MLVLPVSPSNTFNTASTEVTVSKVAKLSRRVSSLPAKYADSVDLKDGLLKNRVCTVKLFIVESYFSCNTTHTV